MKQKSILHSLLFPFWAVGILKLETILLDPFVDWAKGLSFPLLTAVLCLLAKILCLAIPVAFLESEQECRLKLRFPPPSFWKGGWIAVFIPMSILGIAICWSCYASLGSGVACHLGRMAVPSGNFILASTLWKSKGNFIFCPAVWGCACQFSTNVVR